MGFVKLDCGILDSTLWADKDARDLFITALLMAVPHELLDSAEQLEVRTLEKTGFVVPAGWYGLVRAAGQGIIRRHGMEMEAGMLALERLGAPEFDSRTPDFDGRRLVRISGGYLALNFWKYREKDHTAAERAKRYRAKKMKRSKKTGPLKGEAAAIEAVENGSMTQEQADDVAARTREG